jgi:glycosyltransferase involved in cell wall biosynthesis
MPVFVNQDLDPYLHRLYVKFYASPCVTNAILSNDCGGHIGSGKPRYNRIHAKGWQDYAIDDAKPIRMYLEQHRSGKQANSDVEAILLDVVVPSYRVRMDYLKSICSLKVPENIQTTFIIIVDNPEVLVDAASSLRPEMNAVMSPEMAERILEDYLSEVNTVRVRCNENNLGASASRNRGLDESAAEFVLNLDDDLVPNPDLLGQYGRQLENIQDDVCGLIGLVRFPRHPKLPLQHAAVLMSYLTFMFEIAASNLYDHPAWGVTANILFRRNHVRFGAEYAKSKLQMMSHVLILLSFPVNGKLCFALNSHAMPAGGGEDVDYALKVSRAFNGAKLLKVPQACVVHPFWPGSVLTLAGHFFNWAIGDGVLLQQFPEHRYWSFPNLPETLTMSCPLWLLLGPWKVMEIVAAFLVVDVCVDFCNRDEYKHRCELLQAHGKADLDLSANHHDASYWVRSPLFYFFAHVLGNLYVVVLECGRLWGHLSRRRNLWNGVFHRFDWHCGRLENARRNFQRREGIKFGLFVAILAYYTWGISRSPVIQSSPHRLTAIGTCPSR